MTLEIQQPGMARRAANTSCSQGGRQRQISWRVEWQFPQADMTVFDRRSGTVHCRLHPQHTAACVPLFHRRCATWQHELPGSNAVHFSHRTQALWHAGSQRRSCCSHCWTPTWPRRCVAALQQAMCCGAMHKQAPTTLSC